jgi:hypothetical protein
MTSFFFTFFKVFLNGCLGLFVVTLPRLLKIQRADKVFFHFFLPPATIESAFAPPRAGFGRAQRRSCARRLPRRSLTEGGSFEIRASSFHESGLRNGSSCSPA